MTAYLGDRWKRWPADLLTRPQPNLVRNLLWFAAFETAYYLAYRYGMSFSRACPSPFWFPDSVLLCALLKTRPRNWWIFILAPLPIRLFSEVAHDTPFWFLLATFAIDSAKGLLTATLLRRFMPDPTRFGSIRDFAVFAGFAVLLVPALSAFGGAALRVAIGFASYLTAWRQWFLGDAMTQLVITPVILHWVFQAPWRDKQFEAGRAAEGAVLVAVLIVTTYFAAYVAPGPAFFTAPQFYAPVPFLFWAAIRFGMSGASVAVSALTFFAADAAFHGLGPFASSVPADAALAVQVYLMMRTAPVYLVAAGVEQGRTAERLLRESEERFRKMANSAPVLLWMSGRDKLCEFFNNAWLEFTGRSLEQEMGNGWAEGIHPDDHARCLQCYESAFDARQPFEMDYRLRRHDGEYRWIVDKGVPRFDPNGEFAGYIGSAVDITERKRAEETNQALAHAQRLAVIGELTATIAHEVRQPLAAISIDTAAAEEMLRQGGTPPSELSQLLVDIRQNVTRADSIIGKIKAFLRKPAEKIEPLDINAMVSEALWLTASDAARRGVRMLIDLDRGLPMVEANQLLMQQVLVNLVVNGMEAMDGIPRGERYLTLRTGATSDGEGIEVSIHDRGPGISTNDMPRLFETFFTTKSAGMGLGLSISRSIVGKFGGRIWAENNAESGATFHMVLPMAKALPHSRAA